MTKPLWDTRTRAIAALLAVVTLLLAPATAFAVTSTSHACTPTHSGAAIVSASAPHSGAPCQHAQPGCLTGACAGPAVVSPVGDAEAAFIPIVVSAPPTSAALPAGPRSAPPTPPPNR